MTRTPVGRIALLPLDERPVNVLLPIDVGSVAGVPVDVPPRDALPRFRERGDVAALGRWLEQRAADPAVTHLVVSIDMLLYGGLIPGRTSDDRVSEVLTRLDLLRKIRAAQPHLTISAVTLVMRASDSYSAAEEPAYWSSYGKELHALGAAVHEFDSRDDVPSLDEVTIVPAEVVSDFSRRRLRNHIVNLACLQLAEEGVLDFLAVTADDTAPRSAGSAEQGWLRHWMRLLPRGDSVLMYPGADEVGSALVARALSSWSTDSVSFRVICPQPGGLDRIPPYENRPLAESISRQVRAAGARESMGDADITLVVHAPDPLSHDMGLGYPDSVDEAAVDATVEAIRAELRAGRAVALADVRYPNGSDPALLWRLAREDLLGQLTAFSGWNTAGNTLGSVVALATASVVGTRAGTLDPEARERALLTRLLDDFVYQSVVRTEEASSFFANWLAVDDDELIVEAERAFAKRMAEIMSASLPAAGWTLESVVLPWRRSFEVEIRLAR